MNLGLPYFAERQTEQLTERNTILLSRVCGAVEFQVVGLYSPIKGNVFAGLDDTTNEMANVLYKIYCRMDVGTGDRRSG